MTPNSKATAPPNADMKAIFQAFKQHCLVPPFRQAGFRIETPGRYVRDVGEVRQEVHVNAQGNRRGDPNRGFTLDLAMGEPLTLNEVPAGCFTCRLGYLKCASDAWYHLYPDNVISLGERVTLELERYALPLLEWATTHQRVAQLQALTAQGHGELCPRLRELVPGFGRDLAAEYQALWATDVAPLLAAAGFTERDNGLLCRTLEGGITQAFALRHMQNNTGTLLDMEGILALHLPTTEHPEPHLPLQQPAWWLVSSTYVITGQSSHYRRYQLAAHTPAQMGALLRNDLAQHLLPWFDRHSTASTITHTQAQVDAYLQQRAAR